MGIDIYLKWDNQSKAEHDAQLTGFSVTHGHVGYLREAYHGGPYATHVLCPESFDHRCSKETCTWDEKNQWFDCKGPRIPAAILRSRLPEVLETAREREQKVYGGSKRDANRVAKSYEDFVALAEKMEAETGQPCNVYASY